MGSVVLVQFTLQFRYKDKARKSPPNSTVIPPLLSNCCLLLVYYAKILTFALTLNVVNTSCFSRITPSTPMGRALSYLYGIVACKLIILAIYACACLQKELVQACTNIHVGLPKYAFMHKLPRVHAGRRSDVDMVTCVRNLLYPLDITL